RLLPLPRNAPCHDRSDFNRAGLQLKASLQPDRGQEPDRSSELEATHGNVLLPAGPGFGPTRLWTCQDPSPRLSSNYSLSAKENTPFRLYFRSPATGQLLSRLIT